MNIIKRNNTVEPFYRDKVVNAITGAMDETEKGIDFPLAFQIAVDIEDKYKHDGIRGSIPTVEDIQDEVEHQLMCSDRKEVAKRYILYREERAKKRNEVINTNYKFLTDEFLDNYKYKKDPFTTELGKFVYYRTYSRPIPEQNRREKWWETVARVVDFNSNLELEAYQRQGKEVTEHLKANIRGEAEKIYDMMYNLQLFPSGRSLWIGGTKSSKAYPTSNFNCSFVTIDELKKFSEIFSVLMLGTGAGLSVENKYIKKLPKINGDIRVMHRDYQGVPKSERLEYTELNQISDNMLEITIGDSKFGWSKAMELYLDILSSKHYKDIDIIVFNYDNVRPSGELLKTFGGRASGHTAIKTMFTKIDKLFKNGKHDNGKKWKEIEPIDALDIATIIAENVISGGVRRSALIVFCDNDDTEVIEAKKNLYQPNDDGEWVANDDILHRMLSNNTVIYEEKPTREQLHEQFKLIRNSGEPSFGNMAEMKRRRDDVQGGNPCFEILLRDRGVCNLTEVNLMGFVNDDGSYDRDGILEAQRLSAKMGYRMATVELEFHEWDLVNREDRLIGCSLTGMMDFKNATDISRDEMNELMEELKEVAHESANKLAHKLQMNESKLYTCIKPSGTISQLPTVSSGVHYSHAPYYIRRVRVNATDPLAIAMAEAGFDWKPEVGTTVENHSSKVFEFPVKAPKGKTKYDVSAIEQLELYKDTMDYYSDHNSSNTIHVRDDEWEDVENWVYNNWDSIVGVTFLSLSDTFYQLMPYEAIDKEEYEEMLSKIPKFKPEILADYEDFTKEFDLGDEDCGT